jgi:hypothetical protein
MAVLSAKQIGRRLWPQESAVSPMIVGQGFAGPALVVTVL